MSISFESEYEIKWLRRTYFSEKGILILKHNCWWCSQQMVPSLCSNPSSWRLTALKAFVPGWRGPESHFISIFLNMRHSAQKYSSARQRAHCRELFGGNACQMWHVACAAFVCWCLWRSTLFSAHFHISWAPPTVGKCWGSQIEQEVEFKCPLYIIIADSSVCSPHRFVLFTPRLCHSE